jgi:hypothetical protein
MRKELADILAAVQKLTPAEARHLLNAIKSRGIADDIAVATRQSEDWLLPGLEYELRRRGLLALPHITLAWITNLAPNYAADSELVCKTLKAGLKKTPTQAELLNLGRVVAKALADYVLNERLVPGRTLGPRALLQHVRDIPTALNRAFPEYLACGMLSAIVRV